MGLYSCASQKKSTTPILTGVYTAQQLSCNKHTKKWFKDGYNSYILKDSIIKLLPPLFDSVTVIIVCGNWCSDTRLLLPAFFKCIDAINISHSKVSMYFVDKSKLTSLASINSLKTSRIPTFYIYKNGLLVAKIIETVPGSIEEELLKLLSK